MAYHLIIIRCMVKALWLVWSSPCSRAVVSLYFLQPSTNDWNGRYWAFFAGILCGLGNGLQFMGGQAAGYAAADAVQVSCHFAFRVLVFSISKINQLFYVFIFLAKKQLTVLTFWVSMRICNFIILKQKFLQSSLLLGSLQ